MKNKHKESLQNRFSAYLVAAATNKRIRYMEKKKQLQLRETTQPDLQIKSIWTSMTSIVILWASRQNLFWKTGNGLGSLWSC